MKPTAIRLLGTFLSVWISVFALVFGFFAIKTELAEKWYVAMATVEVSYTDQHQGPTLDPALAATESHLMESEPVLNAVINDLNLEKIWAARYGVDDLKNADVLRLLRSKLAVHPIPETALIQIRVVDTDSNAVAAIANSIARVYVNDTTTNSRELRASIIEHASPPEGPIPPNVGAGYSQSMPFQILLASLSAIGVTLVIRIHQQRNANSPPAGSDPKGPPEGTNS